MKIFISWSGKRSQIIAEGLNNWLPQVIQSIEIFYSSQIEKGTRGGAEINASLEGTSFGIICLTPDNLDSTWIHYEAGALAKINDSNTRVWTLLIGLNPSDVEQPLAQFQHTLAQKADIYKMLRSINQHLEKPLSETALEKTFERWWSDFEDKIKESEKLTNENQITENIRKDREVLDEILDILRNQQRFRRNKSLLIQDIIEQKPLKSTDENSNNDDLIIILTVKEVGLAKYDGDFLTKMSDFFSATSCGARRGETDNTLSIELKLPTYIPSSIFLQEFEKFNQDWGLELIFVDWIPQAGDIRRFERF